MKWLHNLLKGFSLTTALFIFQACYGTPEGYNPDYLDMQFKIVSSDTEEALEGVKVSIYTSVGEDGEIKWYKTSVSDSCGNAAARVFYYGNAPRFYFEPSDGEFVAKDTTIADVASLSPHIIRMQRIEKELASF